MTVHQGLHATRLEPASVRFCRPTDNLCQFATHHETPQCVEKASPKLGKRRVGTCPSPTSELIAVLGLSGSCRWLASSACRAGVKGVFGQDAPGWCYHSGACLEATEMKTTLMAMLLCATILAAAPAPPQNAFSPDQIKFGPVPPALAPGAQLAVLEGDPMGSSGDFTIRLKMPNGYRVAPHWHPKRENVTVVSGSFKVGMGDSFDAAKMTAFPAGSFAYLRSRHAPLRNGCRRDSSSSSRGGTISNQLR